MSTTAEERTHPTDTGGQYAPALADARQPAATARTAKTGLKQQVGRAGAGVLDQNSLYLI